MFFLIRRYPYICMVEDFAVGKSKHLKGDTNMARLTLDPQAGCFMYQTDEGTYVKVVVVPQALVAIPSTMQN